MARLEKKTAIITGAASGIGRGIAQLFAAQGAKVIIADIAERKGSELANELVACGGEALFIPTDVSRTSDVESLITRITDKYGALHILVNNAAVWQGDTTITQLSEGTWDKVIDGTLKSVYLCTKYALPEIIKSGGGSIVNIASVNAIYGVGLTAYTAAKGGVVALTRLIAAEYGDHKIRANVILPGTIETESSIVFWESNVQALEEIQKWYPIGRIGTPQDVAYCALYLASEEAAFVTGSVIVIDGGLTAGKKLGV